MVMGADIFSYLEQYQEQAKGKLYEVFPLLGNRDAMIVASQWSRYQSDPTPTTVQAPINQNDRWLWIWGHFPRYNDSLRIATGLNYHRFKQAVDLLVEARIVYPDGSLHPEAYRIINASIAAMVPSSLKKKNPQKESTVH
jgi:hypothetical protein